MNAPRQAESVRSSCLICAAPCDGGLCGICDEIRALDRLLALATWPEMRRDRAIYWQESIAASIQEAEHAGRDWTTIPARASSRHVPGRGRSRARVRRARRCHRRSGGRR